MKLVKETLFEKFTEDSDPITDMGIGIISNKQANKIVDDFLKYFKDTWGLHFEKVVWQLITVKFKYIKDDIIILGYRPHSMLNYLDIKYGGTIDYKVDKNLYLVYFVMNKNAANIICSYYKRKDLKNKIPFGWIVVTSSGIEYIEIDELNTLYKKVLQSAFPDIPTVLNNLEDKIQLFRKEVNEMKKIEQFLNETS